MSQCQAEAISDSLQHGVIHLTRNAREGPRVGNTRVEAKKKNWIHSLKFSFTIVLIPGPLASHVGSAVLDKIDESGLAGHRHVSRVASISSAEMDHGVKACR